MQKYQHSTRVFFCCCFHIIRRSTGPRPIRIAMCKVRYDLGRASKYYHERPEVQWELCLGNPKSKPEVTRWKYKIKCLSFACGYLFLTVWVTFCHRHMSVRVYNVTRYTVSCFFCFCTFLNCDAWWSSSFFSMTVFCSQIDHMMDSIFIDSYDTKLLILWISFPQSSKKYLTFLFAILGVGDQWLTCSPIPQSHSFSRLLCGIIDLLTYPVSMALFL